MRHSGLRRAIGISLVLLALAGMLLASIAEAGMLPGSAMTAMADGDCPHHPGMAAAATHVADTKAPAAPATGRALAFMPCCFGTGSPLLTVALAETRVPLARSWLRPRSDIAPASGPHAPELPPPRA